MLKSSQRVDAPIVAQTSFWNSWNQERVEMSPVKVSAEEAETVLSWLRDLERRDLEILEVGCGTGWLCPRLTEFGRVTGTDLATEVLRHAAVRAPGVKFLAGDFMHLDLESEKYDVVISLEVLAHVSDQPAFLARIAELLKPNGILMLATQNRPALERNDIPPPGPGQVRKWLDRQELAALLEKEYAVERLQSITPQFNTGILRYVNSRKVNGLISRLGLAFLSRRIKKLQEDVWLGWTLMVLARKRVRNNG